MNLMPGLDVTASALQAEKLRLDIIGQNIANANNTKGPDGKPYARQTVAFESKLMEAGKGFGVGVRGIDTDRTEGQLVQMPGHPDADKDGNVRLTNVNLTLEMVDMMTASRAYEANLQVVRTAKQMAAQAMRIGR